MTGKLSRTARDGRVLPRMTAIAEAVAPWALPGEAHRMCRAKKKRVRKKYYNRIRKRIERSINHAKTCNERAGEAD